MTRRTFLKSLSIAGAGVAAGLSILPSVHPAETWKGMMSIEEFHRRFRDSIIDPSCCVTLPRYSEKSAYSIRHYRGNTCLESPIFYDSNHSKFYLIDGEWRRAEWA